MSSSVRRPVSRRHFLSAAAAGSTVITLKPGCLWAGGQRRPPLSLLVVTDTHLGYRDQPHAAAQWAKTAAELAQREEKLVLHLGDVVDGGREAQYPLYLESRRLIKKPVHEIPGNHDPPVHEICFPSALYNLDRRLEQQQAPGYNPPEFRPGYTRVQLENGLLKLTCQPTGQVAGVERVCPLRQPTTGPR